MIKKTVSSLFLLLLLLAGCKHEVSPEPMCQPIGSPNSPFGWSQVYLPGYFRNPCYNPNNPNEIVFEQGVYGTSESPRICTFNLQTGEKKTIFTENAFSPPDWGANGKIIFTRPDYNIWQINPDGTGLAQLTTQGWRFGANWNLEGTAFLAGTQYNGHYFSIIHNHFGQVIDTCWNWYGNACWQHDSLICGVDNGLWAVSPSKSSIYQLHSPETPIPGGACWLNNREIIWSYEKGIFITDFITRQTEMVISSCNAITYHHPTFHAVSNRVIWHKRVRVALGDVLHESSKLVMMYPDGSMEEEIFIP